MPLLTNTPVQPKTFHFSKNRIKERARQFTLLSLQYQQVQYPPEVSHPEHSKLPYDLWRLQLPKKDEIDLSSLIGVITKINAVISDTSVYTII